MNKPTRLLALACVLLLAALVAGCASSEYNPPEQADGGQRTIPPGQDVALPPPGQDAAPPPPPGQDAAPPPPPQQDAAPPPPPQQDTGTPPPTPDKGTPPPPDAGTPPPKPLTNKVAAIQYASGQAAQVNPACTGDALPDVCALLGLAGQAHQKGASYIVLPEYGVDTSVEQAPAKGDNPATDAAWPADWAITRIAKQAKQLGAYIVLNLITHTPTGATCSTDTDCAGKGACMTSGKCTNLHNTSIAFDPTGKVVGLHHKFNLFGGETTSLTAGTDVVQGVFTTPNLGKMGMLICADIYGSSTLNSKLAGMVDVVLVSSYWTTSDPINTYYKNYLGKFSYYSVIANTTDAPGYGGGVFKGLPWTPVASTHPNPQVGTAPSIAIAPLPVKP